jgi:hypothetical protein
MCKKTSILLSIILLGFILVHSSSCDRQRTAWNGTIEEVNGVTVVKNPGEPMHSDDVLILEEELVTGEIFDSLFSRKKENS